MSSKRHVRRKQCSGKHRHASEADAKGHIYQLRASGKTRAGVLTPYRCSFCGGFHIGHRPGSSAYNRGGRRP